MVALLATVACRENVEPTTLSFTQLLRDAGSQADQQQQPEPAYRLFQEDNAWASYCQEHVEQTIDPAIDFGSEIVLGVYAGDKPTGGYGIDITAIELRGQVVHVSLAETKPPANAMLIQVVTKPYAIYRIVLPGEMEPGADLESLQFHFTMDNAPEAVVLKRLR